MLLHFLGLLIPVACACYFLTVGSWQAVLTGFLLSGIIYGAWQISVALARRAKIKRLWQESFALANEGFTDELIDTWFDINSAKAAQELQKAQRVQRIAHPVTQKILSTKKVVRKFPIEQLSAQQLKETKIVNF